MEKWWFNSMLFNRGLEYRCGLSKSIDSFGPIENNSVNEDPSILTDMDNNIHNWKNNSESSSYSHGDYLVYVRNIWNLLSDKTFLVRDSNSYSISNWNNNINSCIESYLRSQICIDSYILDDSDKYNDTDFNSYICGKVKNSSESKTTSIITITNDDSDFTQTDTNDDSDFTQTDTNDDSDFTQTDTNDDSDFTQTDTNDDSDFTQTDTNDDSDFTQKYKHLWEECENCYGLNYKKFFKSKMNICEHCGCHLKMSSSDRIELLIDPGTWNPMDEDMVSVDPIEWNLMDDVDPIEWNLMDDEDMVSVDPIELNSDSEEEPYKNEFNSDSEEEPYKKEEPYKNRLDSYQKTTGLMEAIQTGTGQLNGIPVAIGIMDFQFMGGSMGSVVGEKITRLIEYATNQFLPLIIVCASGGARMQEGSLSLMQMAKISSALYNYQINQKLFYVPILTSPTTGGVTASFGMLGDIIIAEPDAYIAFAGKRVIEQTLNTEVPEGSQSAEFLFEKGLFDSIVPRNPLKEVLTELFQFHGFLPLTQNEK